MHTTALHRIINPAEIVASLPTAPYSETFHPTFPDTDALEAAVIELQATTPVTTPRQIDSLRQALAAVAAGNGRTVIISGRCAEPVSLEMPIEDLAQTSLADMQAVSAAGLSNALHILRGRGQNTKPRSSEHELVDGQRVFSFFGGAVNSIDPAHRVPDPSRMVAAAVQARDLEATLRAVTGRHIPAAHEALLLPLEQSFVAHDEASDQSYLLSADMPWVGMRTNGIDSPQLDLLATIANPVGIKIGSSSTPEHIKAVIDKLNPERTLGKLAIMLRLNASDEAAADAILPTIAAVAPESILLWDIHGVTRTVTRDGKAHKIRAVPEIVRDIAWLSQACGRHGLRLSGVHLETMGDNRRFECVDESDQMPTHPGGVDPQLNPRQLQRVLSEIKEVIG